MRPEWGGGGRKKVSWDNVTFITNTMKMVDFKFKWKIQCDRKTCLEGHIYLKERNLAYFSRACINDQNNGWPQCFREAIAFRFASFQLEHLCF